MSIAFKRFISGLALSLLSISLASQPVPSQARILPNQSAVRPDSRPAEFPTTQLAKLLASDKASDDYFGSAVAISADGITALIGANYEDDSGLTENGAAYIFIKSGSAWTQQTKLLASDKAATDRFGTSVALSSDGNTAVVGAYQEDSGGFLDNGAAYVFTRSAGVWTQQAKLLATDKGNNEGLGWSVSVSADGNTAIAGAIFEDDSGLTENGAAYVFTRSGSTWTQQAKLLASDKAAGDDFGSAISISTDGNTAVVGAAYEDDSGTSNNGAAYVFTRSGGTWTQQAKLLASDKAADDDFGWSIAISGDGNTAMAGAFLEDSGGVFSNGAAYIFTRSGSVWTQQTKLLATGSYTLGWSVALSANGNTAIAGAYQEGDSGLTTNGATYVFTRSGGSWTQQNKLLANDKASGDFFGVSVAVSSDGNTTVIGASQTDNSGTSNNGAAYIFVDVIPITATPTSTPVPGQPDTIGVYKNSVFYLRNSNNTGVADITAAFGGSVADLPVVGDWNGDGVDTIGVYRNSTGFFFLSNSNTSPVINYSILFGNPGDTPFAGKWTADMTGSGIGVYRNSNGILYLRKSLTSGVNDFFAIFGNPGDQGMAGDWDGNGFDSVGIYRSSNLTWYLTNNSTPSGITFSDLNFVWNIGASAPVVGDWDGNGTSTPGFVNSTGLFVLHGANATAGSDNQFAFGPANSKPVAGKWVAGSNPPISGLISPITGAPSGRNSGGSGSD